MPTKRRKPAFRLITFPQPSPAPAPAPTPAPDDAQDFDRIVEHLTELRDTWPGMLEFVARITGSIVTQARARAR